MVNSVSWIITLIHSDCLIYMKQCKVSHAAARMDMHILIYGAVIYSCSLRWLLAVLPWLDLLVLSWMRRTLEDLSSHSYSKYTIWRGRMCWYVDVSGTWGEILRHNSYRLGCCTWLLAARGSRKEVFVNEWKLAIATLSSNLQKGRCSKCTSVNTSGYCGITL